MIRNPLKAVTLALSVLASGTATAQSLPPVLTLPAPYSGSMRLEPWTNGRYIIRDASGRQIGTVEPYVNGWIIRDNTGRETGRIMR